MDTKLKKNNHYSLTINQTLMKTTKSMIAGIFALLFIFSSVKLMAQTETKFSEVKIKTSAVCGMCKDRIEKALAYEKGVKQSVLNLEDKVVTVTFDADKTNPDKIRLCLSKTGYDADQVAADPKAYEALPPCCKKKASQGSCQPGGNH
jgi:periplasmic mercuric ion binding protein